MSPRIRSPSPIFAFPGSPTPNLMSPASDSSGFSSKKSSNDNFNLEGMYIYIYKRLKWFVKQHQVHKTK